MAAKTLRNWTVTRSGSGLVAHGENIDTAQQDKITSITSITPPDSHAAHEVKATDKDGTEHRLIFI